jgi:O-acetyl-ADP-ribose deacetylase (regulator of RNase III)
LVKIVIGNLFESKSQTLVNAVNTVGVMGAGIALEFKNRFPEMYRDYVARCNRREVKLGEPYLFKNRDSQWILNFPTKDHWRSASRIDNIMKGLDYLEAHYREWRIQSLAVPALGCGNGQLDWAVVGPILYSRLKRLDIPIDLYAPFQSVAHTL